ncbi:MAG: hypothetical protein ACRCUM_02010, partial [Mycoplasmoidaceae bacterium]
KKGITFKNDGNTISWDDAVSSLKITGPQFTQVAKGEIEGISIELVINPDYVVLGASLNNIKFTTGNLGKVGTIPILELKDIDPLFDINISSNLTEILNSKSSYQEMKKTYDSWIDDPLKNLPNSIISQFHKNFIFTMPGGTTLSFSNIVETLKFKPKNEYPQGVNQKVPNFEITIVLKEDGDGEDDYVFIDPSEKEFLTIQNININSHTLPIDTTVDSVNNKNIEDAFNNYFNKPNADDVLVYQEVRQKYNDLTGENGIVPDEIRNAILENIKLNFPDYENPPTSLDDVIETIKISSNGDFPNTANSPLPNITLNLSLKPDFKNLDSSITRPINIDLGKTSSGIIKYDVMIDNNLTTNFGVELYNFLQNNANANTWQAMKNIYDGWKTFDDLPESAKKIIKDGITFTPSKMKNINIDLSFIEKSNSFDSIINNISLSKGEFSEYGKQIEPIDLELTMINDAFHSDNYQRKIEIKGGPIGVANKQIVISVEPIAANISNINSKIQGLISQNKYIHNKNTYDYWKNIDNFGIDIKDLILKESISIKTTHPGTFTLNDIIDKNSSPTISKEQFPNEPNMPINNFYININLNEKFILNTTQKSFVINLGPLQSKGDLVIEAKIKNNATQTFENYFTDVLNKYLVSGVPSTTPENRLAFMKEKYKQIPTGNVPKFHMANNVSYINKDSGNEIDVSGNKFDKYFTITSEIGSILPTTIDEKFPPVTIKVTLSKDSNFLWSGDKLTLIITTDVLKSANENLPS